MLFFCNNGYKKLVHVLHLNVVVCCLVLAALYNHMVRCSILVYADVMIMKTKLWLRWTDWKNQALEGRVIIFVINSIYL